MAQLPYKNIIFDFDGTIADTFDAVIKIVNKDPGRFGIDGIDETEVPRLRGMSMRYLIREFNVNLIHLPKFVSMVQAELYEEADTIEPFPGIVTLLLDLKSAGAELGIITSNSKKMVERFLAKEDIHVFDYIHSEKAFFGKHQAIKNIMTKHSFEKEDTIYIGDEVRDIEATKRVSLPIASVAWGYNDYKALKLLDPDFIAVTTDDLRSILLPA